MRFKTPSIRIVSDSNYFTTRLIFQRFLAFIYLVAFLVVVNQYCALVGENGILPIATFMERVSFWDAPSIFQYHATDALLKVGAWTGVVLAFIAMLGLSEKRGLPLSMAVWGALWLLYLSFVNAGQLFYGFGWESILLETGFLAIFLGSRNTAPPRLIIWLLRWTLFRVMFGAGLIKIRGDECWRDLTCMAYHYETQPMPNPLSWHFHKLPLWFHKIEILFTHFVELVVPWFYFYPRRLRVAAAGLTFLFQGMLILSGNLSWLNYMTLLLCVPCLDDSVWHKLSRKPIPSQNKTKPAHRFLVIGITVLCLVLSYQPTLNLFSPRQAMNRSYNPLHIVNTYGAFGSVTKVRREVVLAGTSESEIKPYTYWEEYDFKCKPGNVAVRPCVVSPYHYRLDWQIWFAAMNDYRFHPWMFNVVAKLLKGDRATLALLKNNPFPDEPPKYIRADLYEYRFTTNQERRETGNWWFRKRLGTYLPPLSLDNPGFKKILHQFGWLAVGIDEEILI